MLNRRLAPTALRALDDYPVVALLGPRQVGKTTLARVIAEKRDRPSIYLDLERPSDRDKLIRAEEYLLRHRDKLVVLDEIQSRPDLFPLLRGLIDERIHEGDRAGHFLILGSASPDLLRQSSESLAGRILYLELAPLSLMEAGEPPASSTIDRLWVRGGFPRSYLASDDAASFQWRGTFVETYIQRDLAALGFRLPPQQMSRFWQMLAFAQAESWNAAKFAASLGVTGNTVRRWLDVLTDLFLVRQLRPWSGNSLKRLVHAPKIYLRDSGLVHRLTVIPDLETLLGHPLCGHSWEGFAIEQLLSHLGREWQATYYRTSAGAEIDLLLEGPARRVVAIEVKRGPDVRPPRGFLLACEDVKATERFVVKPSGEAHPVGHDVELIALANLVERLAGPMPRSRGARIPRR